MQTLFDKYVLSGGVIMIPLLLCSILAIGSMLQNAFVLRRTRVLPRRLLEQSRQWSGERAPQSFLASLKSEPSPLGRALHEALRDFAARGRRPAEGQLDPVVESATEHAADRLYERLGLLSTLYTISPLLGLMGTVLGMMKSFYEFSMQEQRSVAMLSIGIQEALITTLWGIGIAVVAFVGSQWFHQRVRRYERDELPAALREVLLQFTDTAPSPSAPTTASTTEALALAASRER